MTTFLRAHSPEQREARRKAILETAAQMLDEMPAAAISLNELSRRVGMAKSNVLRYFESREAVLLELCTSAAHKWLDELDGLLTPSSGTPPQARVGDLADTVTSSLAGHPVLCDLMSVQAAVLEHNLSLEAVLRYKSINIANYERLSQLSLRQVPELGAEGAARFAALLTMLTASIWTHSHPPAAVLAAYEADPAIAAYRMEFQSSLRESLEIVLAGLLARA